MHRIRSVAPPVDRRRSSGWFLFGLALTLIAVAGPAEGQAGGRLEGKVVMVTGSTDGLGREVALRAAREGAHVIVHGRNRERGEAVVAEIEAGESGSAAFYAADFASFDDVRRLAGEIQRDYDRLDVLVNNAGIWIGGPSGRERLLSQDGHELHFQVNYLAHFLLTELLKPLLVESSPSRIVNVASAAQTPIVFEDVDLADGYTGSRAYGQSKLAQILMTVDLAQELEDDGVMVTALHPATLMDTELVREAGIAPRSTIDEGAEAVMHLVVGDDVASGDYYNGQTAVEANAQAYDAAARARLREISLGLTGLAQAPPLRSTPVLAQPLTGDPALAGKTVTASQLELAPGALLTNPHSHPGELFGYILEGSVLTGLNNATPQRYDEGQMFYEYRGVTHTHFQNVSQTEPARVLIFLIGEPQAPR